MLLQVVYLGSDPQWHQGGIGKMSREGRTKNRGATVGHFEISILVTLGEPWRACPTIVPWAFSVSHLLSIVPWGN